MDGAPNIGGTFGIWFYICAFDETLREAQLCAEESFAAGHLAGVGFVIVTGEVEQAVEDEDLNFCRERMTLVNGLLERSGDGDGQVAGDFFSANAIGGKGEHVGHLVLIAELAVELADGHVGGEQDGDFAFETDCGLRFGEKAAQSAGGG